MKEEDTLPSFSLDMEELSTSETPIFESKTNTPEPTTEPVSTPEGETQEPVVEEGVDIDFLAESEEIATAGEDTDTDPEETDPTKAPASSEGKGTSSQSQNPFSTFTSVLSDAGTFSSLTDEDIAAVDSAEKMTELIAAQIKVNELKDLNDVQKQYVESIRNGVSQQDFVQHQGAATQYNLISDEALMDAPEMSKELIKRDFIVKGFDPETADEYAELAMTDPIKGTDAAIKAKSNLVAYEQGAITSKIEAAKVIKQEKLNKESEELEVLKSKINEGKEIFAGVKVNATTKDKIFESMTTPVGTTESGDPVNELMQKYGEDPEFRLKMHAMYILTKGFTSTAKLTSNTKNTATKKLAESLAKATQISTGSSFTGTGSTTGFTSRKIGEYLNSK